VLAAGIAHDFNNLLGSICAEVDLALAAVRNESPVRESLDRIGTVAVRGSEISNLLMDYAGGKGDSSGFELVNLSALMEEMVKLLKASLSKKAVLEIELDYDLPAIRVNPPQIRRVITNLVTNASEALEGREGLIRITSDLACVNQENGSPGGLNLPQGEYVSLTIADTGCGMAERAQANAFDPFYSTKAQGRGLGLSAVQGILRAHGGGINLVSAPGKGSTFQVLLPYDTDANEKPTPTAEAGEQPTSMGQVVLLVEDENTLRLAVSRSLRKHGFVVMDAEDGQAAVDRFRAHAKDIDLVLLDLTLPDLSGPEVFSEFRRVRPDVKVLFTSAYDPEVLSVGSAYSEEVLSNFIRKPYRIKELVGTLREALAAPKSHSAASNG
jgi:two-component system, cell cycle sensor histidine kinase and response regulator CckA